MITTTTTILQLSGFCPGQPGWHTHTRRNIHPLTPIVVINHPLSTSSIYYDPWHPSSSICVPDSLFAQSLSKFSLVYLLPGTLDPVIVLFLQHMLIHTIATCFAVVPRLCHLILVSLSPFTWNSILMPHIHLIILIYAHWSATSLSFVMCQVSLPCSILLRTQLLYNLPLNFNDISLLVSNGTKCLN